MENLINQHIESIRNLCQSLNVKRLYIFGSFSKGNFNQKSDIDFLLAFNDNISPEDYMNNYFTLQYELRKIFDKDIDLVTERTLSNPYFIQSINESKQLIYEA